MISLIVSYYFPRLDCANDNDRAKKYKVAHAGYVRYKRKYEEVSGYKRKYEEVSQKYDEVCKTKYKAEYEKYKAKYEEIRGWMKDAEKEYISRIDHDIA